MEISDYLIKRFLDSCSYNKHDLSHRRKIINIYKNQIKIIIQFLEIEDKSLKKLEDGNDKIS
tara:strand:- start:1036 stop:1221 length:186 start_codon:yes stop_codon:yes gene_type:complete